MKLEPNMYVRTKNGVIAKIEQIVDDEIHFNIKPIFSDGECLGYNWFYIKDVEKASHNIIDLIEVDDYVNGSKVIDISIIGKDKEKWVWVEQMEDTDNKYGDDYVGYNNDQIKSIVTKEQFESMKYSLEG